MKKIFRVMNESGFLENEIFTEKKYAQNMAKQLANKFLFDNLNVADWVSKATIKNFDDRIIVSFVKGEKELNYKFNIVGTDDAFESIMDGINRDLQQIAPKCCEVIIKYFNFIGEEMLNKYCQSNLLQYSHISVEKNNVTFYDEEEIATDIKELDDNEIVALFEMIYNGTLS